MKSRSQRSLSVLAFTFFLSVGTYNAVVINSESQLSGADIKFVKRLDELYGPSEPDRLVATWQKVPAGHQAPKKQEKMVVQTVSTIQAASEASTEQASEGAVAAAVQDELDLGLVEVINPKKWQQGLAVDQFSGSLKTNNGIIEALNVSLPNGEGLSVSFSEMSGNVFEYDLNGEIYSGMMYQVDQSSYMLTLTNGPLEGTRMKFVGDQSAKLEEQEAAEVALQGTNSETDNYGQPTEGEIDAAREAEAIAAVAQPEPQVEQAQIQPLQPVEGVPEGQIVDAGLQPVYNPEEAANLDMQLQQQGLESQNFTQETPVN